MDKRLIRIAAYLRKKGLYKEAAQIKKMASDFEEFDLEAGLREGVVGAGDLFEDALAESKAASGWKEKKDIWESLYSKLVEIEEGENPPKDLERYQRKVADILESLEYLRAVLGG